jgi:hypothetical protein
VPLMSVQAASPSMSLGKGLKAGAGKLPEHLNTTGNRLGVFFFFFVVLGFELRTQGLLGRCCTVWAPPPTLLASVVCGEGDRALCFFPGRTLSFDLPTYTS